MSDAIIEDYDEILSRLKFIGCIERDEKINARNVIRQPNNWLTTFVRTLMSDSRVNTLKFVRNVINRSFEIADYFNRKNNGIEYNSVISDLIKAREGILSLKYTYATDTKFCCDLDVLLESMRARLPIANTE
jgi:hypothetical protein